ncbi:MAG TPA: hypothetical protein VNF68_12440 [Candidatus Baltobacteraceae bacterium]|nr:hypothetical protein [Candidatus Baltobacteraceae bacterium]
MIYHAQIMKYGNGYSALVLEEPGVIAAADTLEATQALIAEALQFHLHLEAEPEMEFLRSA